jgi:hypothetical protein
VLLKRLDDLGATDIWPIAEGCGVSWDGFLGMWQQVLSALFPEECGEEGGPYTPDPAQRMRDAPSIAWKTVRKVEEYEVKVVREGVEVTKRRERVTVPVKVRKGLFPYPCEGVGDARSVAFAEHLLKLGKGSPAAKLAVPDPKSGTTVPLLTDADLACLGERIERREAGPGGRGRRG